MLLSFDSVPGPERKALPDLVRVVEWEREPGSGDLGGVDQPAAGTRDHLDRPHSGNARPAPGAIEISAPHRFQQLIDSQPANPGVGHGSLGDAARRWSGFSGRRWPRSLARIMVCATGASMCLRSLGSGAWPALLDLYADGQGVASDLARQILLSPDGLRGGQLVEVMRVAGAKARFSEPVPEGVV